MIAGAGCSYEPHFLQQVRIGIHVPPTVEFALSDDGRSFDSLAVVEPKITMPKLPVQILNVRIDANGKKARFIPIRAKNTESKNWLFVDDLVVRDTIDSEGSSEK